MNWAANWYKVGDVTVGKEIVLTSAKDAHTVVINDSGQSIVVNEQKPLSVIIEKSDNLEITISNNSASVKV